MGVIRSSYSEASSSESKQIGMTRKISKKIDILDKKMDSLYSDIYISRPDNRQNLDSLVNDLDTALDKLYDPENDISGMSELLRRIEQRNGSSPQMDQLYNGLEEIFNDRGLINSLFENEELHRYIAGQNYQYDMICHYLPKLEDALDIKKDNVLSSDNFSKQFINPESSKSSKEEISKFVSNSDRLETEYSISAFLEKTYQNASKYGEDFIYIVPYKQAFEKFLEKRRLRSNGNSKFHLGQISFNESDSNYNQSGEVEICLSENFIDSTEYKKYIESVGGSANGGDIKFKGHQINLHFNDSNIVLNAVNERCVFDQVEELDEVASLSSLFEAVYSESSKDDSIKGSFDKAAKQYDKLSTATDGLIVPDSLNNDSKIKIDQDINGAVLERLPRENIIPIYIGKRCLGYYYFDFKEDSNACGFCGGQHMSTGMGSTRMSSSNINENQQELALRYISSKLSTSIDSHFINANKDLKEDIYAILSYNDKFDLNRTNDISVTFIPAADIVHCYFDIDEKTHRGISDLKKSVVPAMLYILLYLTDIIGKITRSTDKRIYYVKQNVETNVARTMMNVIQQIKKGNMGMRQIESMNNILNTVGKYNDFIIPLGQSGDAPIQFEVMNGQEIQTPTDIMEKMEEAAVNATGTPYEMVNATFQQDFAIRFSMSNTRYLKAVNTRQRLTSRFFSLIYTKVYNYEYQENNKEIKINLPPPTLLTMTNNQQLIDNISQLADKIIETELSDQSDEVKVEFKKLYTRNYLSTYINFDDVERVLELAKVNVETQKDVSVDSNNDDDMDDYVGI